jgi:hypothetical protein
VGYYGLVLNYLEGLWQGRIALVADLDMDQAFGDTTFEGSVKSYSHIKLRSLQYGAATAHRGRSARYAYINHHNPVEIQHIFQIQQVHGDEPPLIANIALVRPFQRGNDITIFPWELWYVD